MGRGRRQGARRHKTHVLCSRSAAPIITGNLAAELPRPGMLGSSASACGRPRGDCAAAMSDGSSFPDTNTLNRRTTPTKATLTHNPTNTATTKQGLTGAARGVAHSGAFLFGVQDTPPLRRRAISAAGGFTGPGSARSRSSRGVGGAKIGPPVLVEVRANFAQPPTRGGALIGDHRDGRSRSPAAGRGWRRRRSRRGRSRCRAARRRACGGWAGRRRNRAPGPRGGRRRGRGRGPGQPGGESAAVKLSALPFPLAVGVVEASEPSRLANAPRWRPRAHCALRRPRSVPAALLREPPCVLASLGAALAIAVR